MQLHRAATAMTITGIHHVGLTVVDAEASAAWYVNILGFIRVGDYQSADHRRRKVFLGHDRFNIRLGLCEHAASLDAIFDETRPGLDHLAFAVDSTDDLLRWEKRLRAHGVTYTPTAAMNTVDGGHVLVLRDPDNLQLELVAIESRNP